MEETVAEETTTVETDEELKADSPYKDTYRDYDVRVAALNMAVAGFANQLNPSGVVMAAEAFLAFLNNEDQPDITGDIEYPMEQGDVTILGPGIFTDRDGTVINWKGENFIKQDAIQRMLSAESR